jgi:hypothetical protein
VTTVPPEELPPEAIAAFWVDQVAAALAQQTTQATAAASAWQSFTGWYTPAEIATISQEMAATSLAAQEIVAGVVTEYVAQVVAAVGEKPRIVVPPVATPAIRNGIDLELVHARPARAYRVEFAKDQDVDAAIMAAYERELALLETDLMLAARDAEHQAMLDLEVTHYRRVLRPELSKTGSCLLCVAASLEIYSIDDLLPLHVHCKCRTMPIIDGNDPAEQLNEEDRRRAYKEAGTTNRQDLSNRRVKVNEHGELGPVLTVAGHRFTGPDDLTGKRSGHGRRGSASGDVDDERTTEQLRETLALLESADQKFSTDGTRKRIADLRQKIADRDGGGSDDGSAPPTANDDSEEPQRPSLADFITDTQQPGADHERMVEDAWRAEMDRQFGAAGLRAEVDFVTYQPDNVHFSGTIYKPDGASIGTYDRVIHRDVDGELYADHSYLKIDDPNVQGTGFADEFNERLYDWYRASGFQRVELDANIDIGGYAWARAGYDFADEFSARKSIERLENEPIGGREDGAGVRDVLDRATRFPFGHPQFPTAFEVSQAGRLPHHQGKQATWPGKRAMIGYSKNWRGVLWL